MNKIVIRKYGLYFNYICYHKTLNFKCLWKKIVNMFFLNFYR